MNTVSCSKCSHVIEFEGCLPVDFLCPKCSSLLFSTKLEDKTLQAIRVADVIKASAGMGVGDIFPRKFGHHEIIKEISRGGMGVVYQARQTNLDRIVALKVLIGGGQCSQEQIERFYRETQAVAKLRHPNIIPIYDMGIENDCCYYTMEYVEGESLDSRIVRGKITIDSAVAIIEQVAAALEHAHKMGIVHRDIKPGNILIDTNNRVRVTDFGLAKEIGKSVTRTGITVGTPRYMSPEQAIGESSLIDGCSDIFSMGAVLYEMLTGVTPFDGQNAVEVVMKLINKEPVKPKKINPKIPRDLELICMKALEKAKPQRYQTAAEFLSDIRNYKEQEPVEAHPSGIFYRLYKRIKRHTEVAAVILLSLIILTAVYLASDYRTKKAIGRERESAEKERQSAERIKMLQATLQSHARQQEKWKILFDSHFTEASFEKWIKTNPGWKIVDGILYGSGKDETTLVYSEPVPGNIRVSFEFIFDVPLKGCFGIAICSAKEESCSGYRFLFFENKFALQKGDTTKRIVDFTLRENVAYKLLAVRENDSISFRIDDKEMVTYRDLMPITGEDAAFFRFVIRGAEVRVANLVIEEESIPLTTSPLFVADKLFNDGLYSHAVEVYKKIAQYPPNEVTGAESLYKVALSYVKLDKREDAVFFFKQLVERYPETKYAEAAKLQIGLCYLNLKDYAKFRNVIKEYKLDLSLQDILVEAPLSVVEGYIAYIGRPSKAQTIQEKIKNTQEFILLQQSLSEQHRNKEKLAEAYLNLASLLKSEDKQNEAAETYLNFLLISSGMVRYSLEARFELANIYCASEDYTSAAIILQELVSKCTPEAVMEDLRKNRNSSIAQSHSELIEDSAVECFIKRIIAQQNLVIILLKLGKNQEALSFLSAIEREYSDRLQRTNQYVNRATSSFSAAQISWARFWAGNIYLGLGALKEALESFDKARLSSSQITQVSSAAANLLLSNKISFIQSAAQLSTNNVLGYNANIELMLYVCRIKLGRKAEALQHLQSAVSVSPRIFGSYTTRVLRILSINSLPEKLPETIEVNSEMYCYLVGVTALAQNDIEKAKIFLRNAIITNNGLWPSFCAEEELKILGEFN
ncbi:MAG: protein kinase [Planctomycetota bacterium]